MRALKLNLGCGHDKRQGYINVDVDPRLKPDVVHDLLKPLPFEKDSASEIVLQDVLEHLTREQALTLLKECARVLKKNGRLIVRVPNVLSILQKYKKQPDLLMLFLYGDTTVSGTWGAHKYGYTPTLLRRMVQEIGLSIFSYTTIDTNYQFVLSKKPQAVFVETYTSLTGFIFGTLGAKVRGKNVHWVIKQAYHPLLSKTVLRFLSMYVDTISVGHQELVEWVKNDLRFSHLRVGIER